MSNYSYTAVDPAGVETRGTLEVSDRIEALRRIKQMGLFPTKVAGNTREADKPKGVARERNLPAVPKLKGRVRPATLVVFTRELATLQEAGMPLLRGLRILQEQEPSTAMKLVLRSISSSIENGSSLSEALSAHPKIFDRLYVSMVKAGELGGALEITLCRLAEFLEKGRKIRGKIRAALFYPAAVMLVAAGIISLMLVFVLPRFQTVFSDLMGGAALPAFSRFVFGLSAAVKQQFPMTLLILATGVVLTKLFTRTQAGRLGFDRLKLRLPILGPVFRKAAIARFARTFSTLMASGVPILPTLKIVKETAGNVVVARAIDEVHESVKEGGAIAPVLKQSGIFPSMVAGMVEIGEQSGALPELLGKVADHCENEVDDATNALTSLLEPIMIVFLAVIVGSLVIAMFLPIIRILTFGVDPGARE